MSKLLHAMVPPQQRLLWKAPSAAPHLNMQMCVLCHLVLLQMAGGHVPPNRSQHHMDRVML